MRHTAYRAILASRPGATAIVTDVCVPISRLAEAVEETQADIAAQAIPGPILGHVGDGNFHAILLVDPANADRDAEAAKALPPAWPTAPCGWAARSPANMASALASSAYMPAEHGPGLGGDGRDQARRSTRWT